MDDLISRADALEAIKWMPVDTDAKTVQRCIEAVSNLPSAQPEPEEFEWCNGCKEYDQEKHCCHRWTKIIRKTVDEIKAEQRWIPCNEILPKETGVYLVNERATPYPVTIAVFKADGAYWTDAYVGERYKNGNILAWMPLPKPYKPHEVE